MLDALFGAFGASIVIGVIFSAMIRSQPVVTARPFTQFVIEWRDGATEAGCLYNLKYIVDVCTVGDSRSCIVICEHIGRDGAKEEEGTCRVEEQEEPTFRSLSKIDDPLSEAVLAVSENRRRIDVLIPGDESLRLRLRLDSNAYCRRGEPPSEEDRPKLIVTARTETSIAGYAWPTHQRWPSFPHTERISRELYDQLLYEKESRPEPVVSVVCREGGTGCAHE